MCSLSGGSTTQRRSRSLQARPSPSFPVMHRIMHYLLGYFLLGGSKLMIGTGRFSTVAFVGRSLLPVAVLTGKSARPTALIDWPVLGRFQCVEFRRWAGSRFRKAVVVNTSPPWAGSRSAILGTTDRG